MSDAGHRYARIQEILAGARGLDGERLDRYLATHCRDDDALRSEVLELLAADRDGDGEDPLADSSIESVRSSLEQIVDGAQSTWLPDKIGSYEIVRQIGQGGMGVVYEATQQSPRRSVAIKLLHPIRATREQLRRFHREAELLGRLQHPGIAQIYEAGTYDVGRGPQPFIAMELVAGVDLRTHCDQAGLGSVARMELLASVADAVQYAHDYGVIHCDLKPDNVLVDQRGQPRVLDFGIARTTEQATALSTILTEQGQIIGTLAYMAPEQLFGSADAMTSRVDVYALGVLGFELLTGRMPRITDDLPVAKAIEQLSRTEAPRASLFDPRLRGDVETILGKALEPDPARRYSTAAALAADLRRHLAHAPIAARPPSRTYLVRKFARRNKVLVGGVLATLAVAITGAVVSSTYAIAATRRADALERANYISGLAAAGSSIREQDYEAAAEHLDGLPAVHRGWEYDYLRARLVHHIGEWPTPMPLRTDPVFGTAGQMFALLSDGSIGTWDAATRQLIGKRTTEPVVGDFGANERRIHGASRRFAAVLPDGGIVIRDLIGSTLARLDADPSQPAIRGKALAWDEAGQRLLYWMGDARIWNGSISTTLSGTAELGGHGAFSPAGNRVAVASGGRLEMFDARSGERIREARIVAPVTTLAFAPDGGTIAVGVYSGAVYLLDGMTLQTRTRLNGHRTPVQSAAWTADGAQLATAAKDGTLRIWDLNTPGLPTMFTTGIANPTGAVIMPDQKHVMVVGDQIRRFPLGDPSVLVDHATFVYYLAFSPDGSTLASSGYNAPDVYVWDVQRAQLRFRFVAPKGGGTVVFGRFPMVAFSRDGRRVVAAHHWGVRQCDAHTGAMLPTPEGPDALALFFTTLGYRPWGPGSGIAISPDRRRLAVCRQDGVDVLRGAPIPNPGESQTGGGEVFPQQDPRYRTGYSQTGRLIGHVGQVYCAAFSPDGTRIVTGGIDATVRIWDAHTCEQLLVLRGHARYVKHVAFSPDGTMIASASGDTTIRLWDTLPLHKRRAK